MHIPYKGGAQVLADVMAGHIQVGFQDLNPAVLQAIQAGKIRALGLSSARRVAAAPQIPTLAESGLPGMDAAGWIAVAVPAGTPPEIATTLNAQLNQIVAEPEFVKFISGMGFGTYDKKSLAEMRSFVETEQVRWARIVQQAGLTGSQ